MGKGGFRGGGYGGGMNMNMIKQAQKMQADMNRLQDELGEMTVEASSGGGVVRCLMSCKQEVKELSIDPELLDPEEIEMLQDLLVAAVNEAGRLAQEKAAAEMSKITGNVKIPGLF
ncbi:MAG: YbaB/EbfC family nucleoid-associated protein [Clostridiales bacterium]|nr:YbaB/EbfC family nucleoid-associated protein [Clostridiales bacterium]